MSWEVGVISSLLFHLLNVYSLVLPLSFATELEDPVTVLLLESPRSGPMIV